MRRNLRETKKSLIAITVAIWRGDYNKTPNDIAERCLKSIERLELFDGVPQRWNKK